MSYYGDLTAHKVLQELKKRYKEVEHKVAKRHHALINVPNAFADGAMTLRQKCDVSDRGRYCECRVSSGLGYKYMDGSACNGCKAYSGRIDKITVPKCRVRIDLLTY